MKVIAIIEDDLYIGDMLEETLRKEQYGVIRAYSGTEAVFLLEKQHPDLVLLDLMLPGLSGEELLPKIKGIPVIIVSAKIDVNDKVALLLNGAADYVTKPFEMKELLARITVQLRKSSGIGTNSILTCGEISMDTTNYIVKVNEELVKLTRTEYSILRQLMLNPTKVITKTHLLDAISEDTPDCVESSLKVHISNLRKKLRDVNNKDYIEAVWGIGFKIHEC